MDPLESCLGGCSQPLARLFSFLSAVWVGCAMATLTLGFVMAIGEPLSAWMEIPSLLIPSPLLLISENVFINGAILFASMFLFFRYEIDLLKWWLGVALLHSLLAMLGGLGWMRGEELWVQVLAWVCWLVSGALLLFAVWFLGRLLKARLGRQFWELRLENQVRRAELEKRGVATFDPD